MLPASIGVRQNPTISRSRPMTLPRVHPPHPEPRTRPHRREGMLVVMPTTPLPPRLPMECPMQATSPHPHPRRPGPSPWIPIRPIPTSPLPETILPILVMPTATLSSPPPRTPMVALRHPPLVNTPLQVQQPHQATTLPRMAASTHYLSSPRRHTIPNLGLLAMPVVGDSLATAPTDLTYVSMLLPSLV